MDPIELGKKHAIKEGIIIGLENHIELTNELLDDKRKELYSFLIDNDIVLTSDINTLDFVCKDDNKVYDSKKPELIGGFNEEYINKLESISKDLASQEQIQLDKKHRERLNHISDTYKSDNSLFNFFGGVKLKAKNSEIEWADKYFESKSKYIKEGILKGLSNHTKIVSYLSNEKTKKLLDFLCENNLVLTMDSNRNFRVKENHNLSKKLKVLFHEDLNEKEIIMNEVFFNRIN